MRWTGWVLGATAAVALLAGPAPGLKGPSVKKVVVNLPFEEAELILTSEAQRQNLNPFRMSRTKIYQFCNLELGIRIYADSPDYGAFQLCSILIYEVDASRTALVSSRQGWVIRALPDHRPGPAALAAAAEFERTVDEIFAAVQEEAKGK
jgi:hypothetical protein